MALDKYVEPFVIYMTFLLIIGIYLAKKAQITLFIAEKVYILIKYLDFSDVFSKEKALILPAVTNLN